MDVLINYFIKDSFRRIFYISERLLAIEFNSLIKMPKSRTIINVTT